MEYSRKSNLFWPIYWNSEKKKIFDYIESVVAVAHLDPCSEPVVAATVPDPDILNLNLFSNEDLFAMFTDSLFAENLENESKRLPEFNFGQLYSWRHSYHESFKSLRDNLISCCLIGCGLTDHNSHIVTILML
jgi:hypothetical protein